MKKNTLIFLFALCPLIPVASHFAYGLILSFALVWLFLFGLLVRETVKKIGLAEAAPYIELICLAGSATIFHLCIRLVFPVLSVALGLYIYVSAFSYLLLSSIDHFSFREKTFLPILPFIPLFLGFSLFREIIGFGTVSLPATGGMILFEVLPGFELWGVGFWGTAGGALILLGFFSWVIKYFYRKTGTERNI